MATDEHQYDERPDPEQLARLIQNAAVWSAWRDEHPKVSVKLHGAELRKADLGRADLSDADLRSADLSGAFLCQADLSGANLNGADLRGADTLEYQLGLLHYPGP